MKVHQEKFTYFSLAYLTNINYLIILVLITYFAEEPVENPIVPILYFLIPAGIAVIISTFIIRNALEIKLDRTKTIVRLAIVHSIALLGLIASFLTIFS